MNRRHRPTLHSELWLLLLCTATVLSTLFTLPTSAFAQEANLQDRAVIATQLLAELDNKALACLNQLETPDSETSKALCDEFLGAVDGELLANYIAHCSALKSWRDEFVALNINADGNSGNGDNDNLQLMVAVEYACTDDVLEKRTDFVVNAFEQLKNRGIDNINLRHHLRELEVEILLRQRRAQLQNSIRTERVRRVSETQRQFDELQNELIRQQNH